MRNRVAILHGINLGALDSRTPPGQPPRIAGRAALNLAVSVSHGVIDEQSSAQLDAEQVSVRSPVGKLSGAARSNLTVGPDGVIDWVTSSGGLALASAARQPGPTFDNPRLAVQLYTPSLGKPLELRAVKLDVPKLLVPSLGWANRWLERAGTPLDLRGQQHVPADVHAMRDLHEVVDLGPHRDPRLTQRRPIRTRPTAVCSRKSSDCSSSSTTSSSSLGTTA